jgi:hypothetical protein
LAASVINQVGRGENGKRFMTESIFVPALRNILLVTCLFLSACAESLPENAVREPVSVRLEVDGRSHSLSTDKTTVRELLNEAGIDLGELDEVAPPLYTPIETGIEISVVRISEETNTVLKTIPFERKIVRNETMAAEDSPVIVQGGKAGLQEETVRIVYRDGKESERWVTQVTLIEPALDEIVMIGIGAARGNVSFEGIIAYMSDGTAVIMRGLTAFPEQLNTNGNLDGRVFALSPTGSHLLYTRTTTNTTSFNNGLWVISTERNAVPQSLFVENVLWAGWNPDRTIPLQLAYTTADSTNLPPGWEANNDLWMGVLPRDEDIPFEPEQLVEAYPATYGWWGGNYAWSPTGRYVAYSYANEVGLIDMAADITGERHLQLQRFTEYDTLLDWVWIPTLSWSPDGRFLAFTSHSGDDPEAMIFDSWVVDVTSGASGRFVEQAGMWAHLSWAPDSDIATDGIGINEHIAFLKSSDPLDSLRSSYTLWMMDQDGSNARQVYPSPGENSYFPREQQFMAWGPDGGSIAFVFDDSLFMLDLEAQEARRITQDDALNSHPTWAPYGRGLDGEVPSLQTDEFPTPFPDEIDRLLPEE